MLLHIAVDEPLEMKRAISAAKFLTGMVICVVGMLLCSVGVTYIGAPDAGLYWLRSAAAIIVGAGLVLLSIRLLR